MYLFLNNPFLDVSKRKIKNDNQITQKIEEFWEKIVVVCREHKNERKCYHFLGLQKYFKMRSESTKLCLICLKKVRNILWEKCKHLTVRNRKN